MRPAKPNLKVLALNNDLCSSVDYTESMAVSSGLHAQLPDLDGIMDVSREMNTGLAVCLFQRSTVELEGTVTKLFDHPHYDNNGTSRRLTSGPVPASTSRHRIHQPRSRARYSCPPAGHPPWHARERDCTNRGAGHAVPVRGGSARSLAPAITKGCRQRCIYPTNRALIEALESYLTHRIERRWRMSDDSTAYRGLLAHSKLILTFKGFKYSMNCKRRINHAGEQVDYAACDALQSHVTKLYRDVGCQGRQQPFWSAHDGIPIA